MLKPQFLVWLGRLNSPLQSILYLCMSVDSQVTLVIDILFLNIKEILLGVMNRNLNLLNH